MCAKYNVGDRVLMVSRKRMELGSFQIRINNIMWNYGNTEMTISRVHESIGIGFYYAMQEDNGRWNWSEDTILGLAEPNGIYDEIENSICYHCNEKIIEEGFRYSGKLYCKNCSDVLFFTCSECGGRHLKKNMETVKDGSLVCDKCLNLRYTKCEDCGEYVFNNEATFVSEFGYVCSYCLDKEKYYQCEDCDDFFLTRFMTLDEETGEQICNYCYNRRNLVIESYHSNRRKTTLFFGGDEDNLDNLFLGVELEIDNGVNKDETARIIKKSIMPKDFINMEEDGSLNEGFENVTMPATYDYHFSIKEKYQEMFELAINNEFRSHKTQTCGLHVHFNRSFYEDREEECIAKLLFLFEKHWDNLTKFSRRKIDDLDRWAKKYSENPDEVIEKMKDNDLNRYYAVNLTNDDTIEFRIFRGTLNLNSFFATLQLVNTMVNKTKTESIEVLREMSFEDFMLYDEIKSYWEVQKNRE